MPGTPITFAGELYGAIAVALIFAILYALAALLGPDDEELGDD